MDFAKECGLPQGLSLLLRTRDAWAWHGYQLHEPYALIGTSEECNVQLSDDSLAPSHVYMQAFEDRLFVCDLTGRQSIECDGRTVVSDWLDPTAEIFVGRYQVRLAPGQQPPQQPPDADDSAITRPPEPACSEILLTLGRGRASEQTVRSTNEISLIGRAEKCKFRIKAPSVAPYHCCLVRTGQAVWLVDLGSGQGTFVDGQPVSMARLNHQSQLRVGRCRFDLELPGLSAESKPSTDARSTGLIPSRSRESSHMPMLHEAAVDGAVSDELVRDLVEDLGKTYERAFEQARDMVVQLLATREQTHTQQMEMMQRQNEQLMDLMRTMVTSRDPAAAPALPPPATPTTAPPTPAPATSASPQPAESKAPQPAPAPATKPPPETDPEIQNAWLRSQLHTISEGLQAEKHRGLKKFLGGLRRGNDDALK